MQLSREDKICAIFILQGFLIGEERKEMLGVKKSGGDIISMQSRRVMIGPNYLQMMGELIKAFATMVSRGVAPSADEIPRQLKAKFPSLISEVRWPNKDIINDLSCRLEQIAIRIELENSDKNGKP